MAWRTVVLKSYWKEENGELADATAPAGREIWTIPFSFVFFSLSSSCRRPPKWMLNLFHGS